MNDKNALRVDLPSELYERLRKAAFEGRESMAQITRRALERELAKLERKRGK